MLYLENLSKTFAPGTVNEKHALNGLSLHLEPGDFAAIVGSNGAGKSTLFGAIAGSFFTDSGRIVLDLKGEQRAGLSVEDLLRLFRENAGKQLDDDRILLSGE